MIRSPHRPLDGSEVDPYPSQLVAGLLTSSLAENDSRLFLATLHKVSLEWGWDRLSRDSGIRLGRLRKTMTPGARPRLSTVIRILKALGIRLAVSTRAKSKARPRGNSGSVERSSR